MWWALEGILCWRSCQVYHLSTWGMLCTGCVDRGVFTKWCFTLLAVERSMHLPPSNNIWWHHTTRVHDDIIQQERMMTSYNKSAWWHHTTRAHDNIIQQEHMMTSYNERIMTSYTRVQMTSSLLCTRLCLMQSTSYLWLNNTNYASTHVISL